MCLSLSALEVSWGPTPHFWTRRCSQSSITSSQSPPVLFEFDSEPDNSDRRSLPEHSNVELMIVSSVAMPLLCKRSGNHTSLARRGRAIGSCCVHRPIFHTFYTIGLDARSRGSLRFPARRLAFALSSASSAATFASAYPARLLFLARLRVVCGFGLGLRKMALPWSSLEPS